MIRPGNISDSQAIADIYNHYVATSNVIFSCRQLSAEEMALKLERLEVGSRFPFIVAEEEGRVVGYAYAHYYQPDPVYAKSWELTLYLAHDYLGRGLGRKMLRRLVDLCREAGAKVLISNITAGNEACERIHRHEGFTLVGHLEGVGYKFGEYHSDVIYILQL